MKHNKMMTSTWISRTLVISATLMSLLFVDLAANANTDDDNAALADEIATLYRAARAVVSQNQAHINNPDIGDKGLSGEKVVAGTIANYEKAKGTAFVMAEATTEIGRAQKAVFDAVSQVMAEAAPLINEKGKGFKGFLPAVFAKAVADKFSSAMGGDMSIKLTAPKVYVRNRKNRPDAWEAAVIEDQFKSAGYEKGLPFSETTQHEGAPVFRYMIPEYYGDSCLACHGGPKGDRDITGGLKEGGVLGELGGAISLVIASL